MGCAEDCAAGIEYAGCEAEETAGTEKAGCGTADEWTATDDATAEPWADDCTDGGLLDEPPGHKVKVKSLDSGHTLVCTSSGWL